MSKEWRGKQQRIDGYFVTMKGYFNLQLQCYWGGIEKKEIGKFKGIIQEVFRPFIQMYIELFFLRMLTNEYIQEYSRN